MMIIKIRGIKQTTVNGRTYYYHRATKKRIETRPHTPAFIVEVAELDKEAGMLPRRAIERRRPHGSGTWGALVEAYRASAKYLLLKDRTKRDYDKVLAYLATLDNYALVQFDAAACEQIRDKALAQKKRKFANYVVQILSLVLAWGRGRSAEFGRYENGAAGLGKFAATGEANRPWTEDECRVVIGEATGTLRVAIALGMFASMRGQDIVAVKWSAYDGKAIQWEQGKTGDQVWKPARQALRDILDATPRVGETIVTGVSGQPWAAATLRKEFRTMIVALKKAGRIAPGLTLHGLRSTSATNLANGGADIRAIQAELGHRTAIMSLHYSRKADLKRAAATATRILDGKA